MGIRICASIRDAARALATAARAQGVAAAQGWRARAAAYAFVPDIVAAPDPLAPDPRVVADGFAAAFARCAESGSPLRLLVARAPGATFRIALSAVKGECSVERLSPNLGVLVQPSAEVEHRDSIPARAVRKLPAFTTGADPSVMLLCGDADDLRFSISPGSSRDPRLRLQPATL